MGAVVGGFDLGKFNKTGNSHIGDPKEESAFEKQLKKAIFLQPVAALGAASGALVFVGGLAFKAFAETDFSARVIVAGGVVGLVSYDVYQVLGNATEIVSRPLIYSNEVKVKQQLGKNTYFCGWVIDRFAPVFLKKV